MAKNPKRSKPAGMNEGTQQEHAPAAAFDSTIVPSPVSGESQSPVDGPEDGPLPWTHYLVMNGIFYAACLLILVLVRLTMQESRGLWYFFGLMMISFSLVSIYDFIYDRLDRRSRPEA